MQVTLWYICLPLWTVEAVRNACKIDVNYIDSTLYVNCLWNMLLELRPSWNLFCENRCLYTSLTYAFTLAWKFSWLVFFTKHFDHTYLTSCVWHTSSEMTLHACTEHQQHRIDFQVTCWLLGHPQLLFLICHLCVYGCLLVCYCCTYYCH